MVRMQLESIAQEAIDLNLAKVGYTAFYVDGTNGLDTYPGDSWEQPFKTIQHAIDEAGSWAKIFVKAGTYAENVLIGTSKRGVELVGENQTMTYINGAGTATHTLILNGWKCVVSGFNVSHHSGVHTAISCVGGDPTATIFGCTVRNVVGYGISTGVSTKVFDCLIKSVNVGIRCGASTTYGSEKYTGNKIYDNLIIGDGATPNIGIDVVEGSHSMIENNTIIDFVKGIDVSGDDLSIIHNNFINNTTQIESTAARLLAKENFYDDHTTDTNNDGLCDTPYSFTGGTDYQPVSRRNGWKQESLGYDSGSEGVSQTGVTYYVGKGGSDTNDGLSWATRRLTVASGYGLCSSGDTLVIGPGTFTEDINFNTDGVHVIGCGAGVDGTMIGGNATMTCRSNKFEDIFFYDTSGTVVKVGADANASYNEFPRCRIGGAGAAIDLHIDGSVSGGGGFNIFDECNFYDATQASVLIDGANAPTGNIFRTCRVRPTTNGHGIHVNHASALRNTFLDCTVVGNSSGGTGIYFQAGLANIAANCHVDDITTPYSIAATNHIVGCHEGSLIATNNTTEDDLKDIHDDLPKNNATNNNYSFVSGGDFTAVNTVFEIADDTGYKIISPWINVSNFTAGATLTFQFWRAHAAAGASYTHAGDAITKVVGVGSDDVEFSDWGHYGYTKITVLSNNAGDNNVDVLHGWQKVKLG